MEKRKEITQWQKYLKKASARNAKKKSVQSRTVVLFPVEGIAITSRSHANVSKTPNFNKYVMAFANAKKLVKGRDSLIQFDEETTACIDRKLVPDNRVQCVLFKDNEFSSFLVGTHKHMAKNLIQRIEEDLKFFFGRARANKLSVSKLTFIKWGTRDQVPHADMKDDGVERPRDGQNPGVLIYNVSKDDCRIGSMMIGDTLAEFSSSGSIGNTYGIPFRHTGGVAFRTVPIPQDCVAWLD